MKISDVNLNDLDVFEASGTPHEWFSLLRAEDPLHLHRGPDGDQDYYCVTRYDDLRHVSKNPQIFSSEKMGAILRDPDPSAMDGMRQIMLNMDPPRHRQYRAIVNKAFTPRMVDELVPAVERIVDRVIDDVIEKGECDFVDDVAAILPMEIICEMMGVPDEERRAVYAIGNRMVGFDDPELQEDGQARTIDDYQTASAEMFMYAEKMKKRAQDSPGDDLATRLLQAEVDGQRLNDLEFNSFYMLLVIAGNETTRTVTTNGMLDLIRHPDQYKQLREDPKLVPSAVEEFLRFNPAVTSFRRQVLQDTELRGVKLEEGAKLALWYPSVNRDEEVFDDPHRFDIERSPNPHLSFGIGEHYCLGANLARMELHKIFHGLVTRLPELELAAEPRRLRSNFINGVKEMRVRFEPQTKKAA
jgi:cholest-4-en-3-one 26-monooxygenase